MADTTLIAAAKLALNITTNAFDNEISSLLDAAYLDMDVAGIEPETDDALVKTAAITYVVANLWLRWGRTANYAQLKASYDEQKAQMQTASGYGLAVG